LQNGEDIALVMVNFDDFIETYLLSVIVVNCILK